MKPDFAIPALDIGGTHVSSALITSVSDTATVDSVRRFPLDSQASAETVISVIVNAAAQLTDQPHPLWGVAIPGPFDYRHGLGDFSGVDKFRSLSGVYLRAALVEHPPFTGSHIVFINDAEAYAIGEWAAAGKPERFLCITLGTGIGSGFLLNGTPVTTGNDVPPHGDIHHVQIDGQPLETRVSSDAIVKAYRVLTGAENDVASIFQLARTGDTAAKAVLEVAFDTLARALAMFVESFRPTAIVFGGSISRSWDVLMPMLTRGLLRHLKEGSPSLSRAAHINDAPLIGAAWWAAQDTRRDI